MRLLLSLQRVIWTFFDFCVLFCPPLLDFRERSRLIKKVHECFISVQLPLQEKHVHTLVILNLINQLKKLEESEHRIEAQAKVYAGILPIYFLINAKLYESIVVNRPPNNHNLLHSKCLRRDLDLAELVLNLLVHLVPHLVCQCFIKALLVQILHCERILLRKNTLIKIWRPNLECFVEQVNRHEPCLQLRLQLLGNLKQYFILVYC